MRAPAAPALTAPTLALALVLLGLALSGCGISVPSSTTAGSPTGAAPPPAQPGAPPATPVRVRPGRQPPPYDSALAAEALMAFANEYINWSAHTVSADMRLLASQSVGQAHAAMVLAAGETAKDYELQRGGIANSGVVEGASPLTGRGGKWVIVTRERTTATASSAYQGLAPEWHVIVAKAIELRPGRWAVSVWQPES